METRCQATDLQTMRFCFSSHILNFLRDGSSQAEQAGGTAALGAEARSLQVWPQDAA